MHYDREFRLAVPKSVHKNATEQERLSINTLATQAHAHKLKLTYDDISRILAERPELPGVGVLEYRYFWKTGEWKKCFQNDRVSRLIEATKRSRNVVAKAVLEESDRTGRNLTFEECVAAVAAASQKGFKKTRPGDMAGETFGAWVVDEKGAYKSKDPTQAYALVDVSCRLCGFKKTFDAVKLKRGQVGLGGCPSCLCSSHYYNNARNSSTAHCGAIARRRFKLDPQEAKEIFTDCVGWFTREVGTLAFIESYTDVMGNPEARAIWTSIHGETL